MNAHTATAPPDLVAPGPPTLAEVDEIVAMNDPVLRNLRITDGYHRLALGLPAPRPGANWCTFAVWASKQAGQTIRGEDLMRGLERALRHDRELAAVASGAVRWAIRNALAHPGTRRWRVLKLLGQEAFARAGDALARGNKKVFDEIGRQFARFLPLCATLPISPDALDAFVAAVPPGEGQDPPDLLKRAFRHLAQALAEPDHGARAELMLLANLEIAAQEQARLQPEILQALEAPCTSASQLGRVLLEALAPGSHAWPSPLRTPLALAVGGAGRVAESALRALLRHVITESMITLALPGGVVKLGRRIAGEPPECLREPKLAELREILARFAPLPGDLDGTGADDWGLLADRMTTISGFFRLRHEDDSLFTPPFTPEQQQALRAGRIPTGAL